MLARVVPLVVQGGKVDELVAFWAGERRQEIRDARGNLGFFVLSEPGTDRVMLMTLWDSAADADASRSIFQAQAAEFGKLLAQPPAPVLYDVRVQA